MCAAKSVGRPVQWHDIDPLNYSFTSSITGKDLDVQFEYTIMYTDTSHLSMLNNYLLFVKILSEFQAISFFR